MQFRRMLALAVLTGLPVALACAPALPAAGAASVLEFHPPSGQDAGGAVIDPSPAAGESLVAGDWDGNGTDTIAWVRTGSSGLEFHPQDGPAARIIDPSTTDGAHVIAGDWDGNGTDTPAWWKISGTGSSEKLEFHPPDGPQAGGVVIDGSIDGAHLIAGDWNGDGRDTVAWWKVSSSGALEFHPPDGPDAGGAVIDPHAKPGEYIIAGDWNGDGEDSLAWVVNISGSLQFHPQDGPPARVVDSTASPGEFLIGGDWDGAVVTSSQQAAPAIPAPESNRIDAVAWWANDVDTGGTNIVTTAEAEIGVPYSFDGGNQYGVSAGTSGPGMGYDCSGLTLYAVYQATGRVLPHSAHLQYNDDASYGGTRVAQSALQPGDLVFYKGARGTLTEPGHVGVYIGSGKIVNAYDTGTAVRIQALSSISNYVGAVRYW